MASFWFWLFSVIVALLVGGIVTLLGYGIVVKLKDLYTNRGIPKRKKEVSHYLQVNKEKLSFFGKPLELNKEQEEKFENERRAKVREFEKLRRIESRTRTEGEDDRGTTAIKQLPEGRLLPNESSPINRGPELPTGTTRKRVKLDS